MDSPYKEKAFLCHDGIRNQRKTRSVAFLSLYSPQVHPGLYVHGMASHETWVWLFVEILGQLIDISSLMSELGGDSKNIEWIVCWNISYTSKYAFNKIKLCDAYVHHWIDHHCSGNELEDILCKISALLFRPQCVNQTWHSALGLIQILSKGQITGAWIWTPVISNFICTLDLFCSLIGGLNKEKAFGLSRPFSTSNSNH